MSAFSEILKSLRFEGALFLNAEFTVPWCVWSRFGFPAIERRLANAERVMFFHLITEGSCKLQLANSGRTMTLSAGDVAFFPNDARHLMGSDLHYAAVESAYLADGESAGDMIHIRHGGGGAATRFVCGYVTCRESATGPLWDALPPVIHLSLGEDPATALLVDLFHVGVRESSASRPGAQAMLAKLSELMFVESLRRYVESQPPDGKGWLVGLRDAQVGQALALLHDNPGRAWTVEELAREVALSRASLAGRFVSVMGETPIQYLTRWRLGLAAQMLRSGKASIERLAEKSGYESAASFTRAFKREFGLPPVAWRKALTKMAS